MIEPLFFDLAASSWDDAEIHAIEEVIASDRFTMGTCVAEFEEAFARYFGKRFAVMVNSGSSANLLCVASLFFRQEKPLLRGDEAIVPAMGYLPPIAAIWLKMDRVELETLNIDVSELEKA